MKKAVFLVSVFVFSIFAINGETLGKTLHGTGGIISFNRLSIMIPLDWNYSIDPNQISGSDSIQLFSNDRNRTIVLSIQKIRETTDFIEAEHQNRFNMLNRILQLHIFKNSSYSGVGLDSGLIGRKGIFSKFDLYKNDKQLENDKIGIVYNYGEKLSETSEVLAFTIYVIGTDFPDSINIIKTIKIK